MLCCFGVHLWCIKSIHTCVTVESCKCCFVLGFLRENSAKGGGIESWMTRVCGGKKGPGWILWEHLFTSKRPGWQFFTLLKLSVQRSFIPVFRAAQGELIFNKMKTTVTSLCSILEYFLALATFSEDHLVIQTFYCMCTTLPSFATSVEKEVLVTMSITAAPLAGEVATLIA